MIEAELGRIAAGESLSMDEMAATMNLVMQGRCSPGEIGLLLIGLREKGETVAELAGAAAAMRQHMTPIRTRRTGVVDTCGTGGDASGTFNISTAAALVTAAAGVPVAKHGNRSITSKSGSADVLAALGVNIEADVPRVEACLDRVGICFCFAPRLHPSMKQVAEVRKQLGVPTIFNLLGPLSNPASAPFQLMGVGRKEFQPLMAEALTLLRIERALVVRGDDGLDEVTIAATTTVIEVAGQNVRTFSWKPEDFGVDRSNLSALRVDSPEASAALVRRVLDGEKGPARDVVLLNAAAALWTARFRETPQACFAAAAEAIDSCGARDLLERLVQESNA